MLTTDQPKYAAMALRTVAAIALTTLIASSLFFALAFAAASIDKTRLGDRLFAAHADGEWSRTIHPYLLRPGDAVNVWTNNECMILYMLVAPGYASPWQEAVSPLVPAEGDACAGLISLLNGESVRERFYHGYLHGYRVLTAALLTAMPVVTLPVSVLIGTHILAFALVISAMMLARRASETEDVRTRIGFLVIGVSLLLFWGLPRAAISISFAFGDMLVIAFAMTFLLRNPLRLQERQFITVCCIFGALDAWLEFLTGQTPLMLALIPGCLALVCNDENERRMLWPRIATGLVEFGGTVVACLLVKWAVAVACFGPEVAFETWDQLRLNSVAPPPRILAGSQVQLLQSLGLPIAYEPTVTHWFLWPLIAAALASPTLGFGNFFVGAAILAVSTIAAAAGLLAAWRSAMTSCQRGRVAAMLVSVGVLLSWYLMFHAHFIIHAVYMVRPLVWLTCVAALAWLEVWWSTRPPLLAPATIADGEQIEFR